MKKVTAILLTVALAIAAGLLSLACANKETAAKEYSVTFELNYSGAPVASVVKVKGGDKVSRPADPSRTGYKFDDWYLDSAPYDFNAPVNSDITLSARWRENSAPVVKENLTFAENDGLRYIFESGSIPTGVQIGASVRFMIEPSPFYTGDYKVLANGEELTPDSSGIYTVKVNTVTEVAVEGLVPDTSMMSGFGTKEKPYKISTPAQWVTVANMINSMSGNIGGRYFELVEDLDFRGFEIPRIELFNGSFDGKGHTMSDFVVRVSEFVPTPDDITTISDSVNAGLFGRVVDAVIKNLKIESADVAVAGNSVMNAGVLAGDVVSSTIQGVTASGAVGYTNTFAYYTTIGGLIGHVRTVASYGPSYVLFCNSEVTINSDYLAYAGGLIGGLSGDSEAVAAIANCAAVGNVLGGHASGGITGYMGSYTSITNCYSTGSVTAETSSDMGSSSAGGIAGYFSTVEAVIANSFTASDVTAYAPSQANVQRGDIFGEQGDGFSDAEPYATESAVVKSYYAPRGVVTADIEYDLTVADDVRALLGWNVAKWTFDGGYPVPKADATSAIEKPVAFTVNLNGGTITENGVTASDEEIFTVSEFTPVLHLSGAGLVPVKTGVMLSGGKGIFSTGIYSDANLNSALPASYLITDSDSLTEVYVGFKNYAEVSGSYYFSYDGITYELALSLDGKGSVSSGAKSHAFTYAVSGDGKIYMQGLPAFLTDAEYAVTDFLNGAIELGEVTAYSKHDAAGVWFAQDGTEYVFELGGKGTADGEQITFTFTDTGVSLNGNELALSPDKQTLSSGSLTLTRSDIYAGKWEADVYVSDYIEFDGKGGFKTPNGNGTETGSYTVADNKITFTVGGASFECAFDARGYLVCNDGTVYGLAGGIAGVWTDEGKDYSLTLDGLTRFGYGYAKDNDGNKYYYTVEDGKIKFYTGGAYSFAATVHGEGLEATIAFDGDSRTLRAENALRGEWFDSAKRKLSISYNTVKLGAANATEFAYVNKETIVFESAGKTYIAVLASDNVLGLGELDENGELAGAAVAFNMHDAYFGKLTNADGTLLLDFNGLGELGGGKVTVQDGGAPQTLSYSVNANGVAEISGYGNVTFRNVTFNDGNNGTPGTTVTGLWVLSLGGQEEDIILGIQNNYAGQWSVQMNAGAGVLVEYLNADYEGIGAAWWFSDSGQPYYAYFRYNEELGGLDVRVNTQTGLETLFTMVEKEDGMTFVSGNTELPLAHTDDAWGAWYANAKNDTGIFEFDGMGLTSDYYRGLVSYYRNVNDKTPETFLYSLGYYNGERVPCLYAISGDGLMLYATFEFTDKENVDARIDELKASGIVAEQYINAPSYADATAIMLIKVLHANVLATVKESYDSEKNNVFYEFGTSLALDVNYGEFDCGYMRIIEFESGIESKTEYVYRTEYAATDGTAFLLSVYEKNSDLESPAYMAVVKVQNGEATVTLINCATAESLPLSELFD